MSWRVPLLIVALLPSACGRPCAAGWRKEDRACWPIGGFDRLLGTSTTDPYIRTDETGRPWDTGETTTTSSTDWDTTTTTTTAPLLTSILVPGCQAGYEWVYWAETAGWTSGQNLVNAWETAYPSGWNEEHDLPSIAFQDAPRTDILGLELEDAVAPADWQPGVNTVFVCGVHSVDPVMAYAFRVYDLDGNFADCAVYASDPNGAATVFDGSAPSVNPVTRPDEISASDCLVW